MFLPRKPGAVARSTVSDSRLGKSLCPSPPRRFESLVLHWRKAGLDSGEAALLRGTLTVFDTVLMVVRVLDSNLSKLE